MAEKALQQVEENLVCSVCLDTYTDPKLLQCHHVFCRECLEGLVDREQQVRLFLTCPICCIVTSVPAEGVAGLQFAFHISGLLDILKENKNGTCYCPEHSTRQFESFCETCEKLICLECVIEHHKNHEWNLVVKLFEKSYGEITSSLNPLEAYLIATDKALQELQSCYKETFEQQENFEAKICEHTRQIQEAAEARKVELLNMVRHTTSVKLQALASQRLEMETNIAQLSSYLNTVRKSLATSSQVEVVKMKSCVEQQAKELSKSFQPNSLKVEAKPNMKISVAPNIIKVCQSFLDLILPGSPDPAQCQATGKGLEVATVGEKATVLLQAADSESKHMIQSIQCELISELNGERVSGVIQGNGQNQYEISYQPIIKGRHQLHIQISGRHIQGSPFNIAVEMSSVKALSTFNAEGPLVIALDHKGEIIITEVYNSVSIYSPKWAKISIIWKTRY